MGPAIAAVLCGLLIGVPIGLLIGSVILRAGVSISNKILGPGKDSFDDEVDDDDYDEDEEVARPRRRYRSTAIPEPSIGRGMLIVLATGIVNFGVGFVVGLVIGGVAGAAQAAPGAMNAAQLLASLISLPIGFLVMAGMCTAMLPTTFARACLVTLFYYLIAIAIGIVVFGAFMVFALGARG